MITTNFLLEQHHPKVNRQAEAMGSGFTKPKSKPELLQCSICFNVYKVPRMLPCQHTFCEGCLHSYIVTTADQSDERREFPCPLCRERTLVPDNDMPRDKWARLFPKNRLMISLFEGEYQQTETCRLHPGKLIEFFCENHVEIGCSTCLITRHKSCAILPLEQYIKSGTFKRNCTKNNDILQQYKKLFEDLIVETGKNVDSLEKERHDVIEHVKTVRQELDKMLADMEEKLIASVEETYQHESESLLEQTSRCKKIVVDIDNSIEQVVAAQTDIRPIQKAEIIVSVEERLLNYGTSIREELDRLRHVNLGVAYDPLLDAIREKLKHMGQVNIERSEVNFNLPSFVPGAATQEKSLAKRHKSKHVVRISEHSVSGENETFFCNVTSSVVLSDGRIVLADDSNSKLKMMNSKYEITFEMKLDSNPLNLASVSDSQLAVTLPGRREITFVDIETKKFNFVRRLSTRLDCWGIDIIDNVVAITTGRDGHSVIIMDVDDGTEMNSFLLTTHADENIRCPVAVVADKKKRLLYITCTGGAWSKGCVVCMDLNGKLIQMYHDPDLDTPRSCAMDRHGKLYICGLESSSVYQINQANEMYKIFPSKTDQVVGPLHLNFIKNYHIRFLVTEVASDTLKIYELPTAK